MVELRHDAGREGVVPRPDLLDMEARERLPWPAAMLTIGLLSLLSWGVLGSVTALLFR